jgi:hypothetical protein
MRAYFGNSIWIASRIRRHGATNRFKPPNAENRSLTSLSQIWSGGIPAQTQERPL